MYTYLEIHYQQKSEFYYVTFNIKDSILSIRQESGIKKSWNIQIPFSKIKTLIIDRQFGGRRVQLYYQDKSYIFYENGLAEIEYLYTHLCRKVSDAIWLISET